MSIYRLGRLRELQQAAGIDYVAIVPGANLIYFTGIHAHLSERPILALLPADRSQRPVLFAPEFEVGKCKTGPVPIDWHIYAYPDGSDLADLFARAARELNLDGRTIGFEPTHMRMLEASLLTTAAPRARLIPAGRLVAELRMVKDADEIARMRRAVAVPERVLTEAISQIKPGMTELDIAGLLMRVSLNHNLRELVSFPLVQTGLSAAFPHAFAGSRTVRKGDLVVIDFGATIDDYNSDITRTIAVGEPSDEMKHIYHVVREANEAGRAAVRPGATCEEVDFAARAVIEKAGYGKYFIHRTGHGIGLEGHEPPYIVKGNKTVLQPGMTFTVEPGIYIEGKGGVRIEDDVLVTKDGGESLTTFSRDLIVL
ncbi:MAG: Xaa-Pro peptidase family protein [Anaerolineae bacterium]|nr:Xaa-Pro peptidase family protein [Thermoflexales bacterium]MDW8406431.1 Xaa-Pro peptidase family protein [Anaerolineae bacterium]